MGLWLKVLGGITANAFQRFGCGQDIRPRQARASLGPERAERHMRPKSLGRQARATSDAEVEMLLTRRHDASSIERPLGSIPQASARRPAAFQGMQAIAGELSVFL
jgi:hypothetical protein